MKAMFRGRTAIPHYDHPLVPTLIELKCRRCGGHLRLQHSAFEDGLVDTPENYFSSREPLALWKAACHGCLLRKVNLSYDHLPDLGELYFLIRVGSEEFWGWNREHLEMVVAFLEGKDISTNRWNLYRKLIPGEWQVRSRREAFIKAGNKMLKNCQ